MRPPRPTDTTDTLIGFSGFFGAVLLVVTITCELTGRSALGWALALLVVVALVAALLHRRAALVRRTGGHDGREASHDVGGSG
ncbi:MULTISPECIES: hypothetical protein [unclassified Curtobacterium]|uniref:hypothetical protein n=1 Tax=unclassified Curtobacterium TaxID=257496 RepID=UPI000DAAAD5A|nr:MULTISPECIES: hypothetical protein [unclassified Curtobacterium]PZE28986.1 hypothetical protein DEI86_04385 [Curtobacterium sp. MCBD17_028]PZE73685.1 hypothetical protein DEI82_12760 [Curtobacterium sp. MCBD17_019]PZF57505.1 hypothetical protein DEI92_12315 [Curtobacterium sp. MCBD17_034]PZF65370.1 hypothetical protein DEI81_04655 [Curtobacterium sp. MCBD17_013]PZM33596.1 hypothetical protein DEI90_11500 [Curtobacterium sp. MCBD17_031]